MERSVSVISEECYFEMVRGASSYLSMPITFNDQARYLDLSMPGCVTATPKRLAVPISPRPSLAPLPCIFPTYCEAPQLVSVDASTILPPFQTKYILLLQSLCESLP